MNGKRAKQLRKLLVKPDARLLVLIHNEFGEKTKDMEYRQVYKAVKILYKRGLIKFKRGHLWNTNLPETSPEKSATG